MSKTKTALAKRGEIPVLYLTYSTWDSEKYGDIARYSDRAKANLNLNAVLYLYKYLPLAKSQKPTRAPRDGQGSYYYSGQLTPRNKTASIGRLSSIRLYRYCTRTKHTHRVHYLYLYNTYIILLFCW
jgi:hypothetical protein